MNEAIARTYDHMPYPDYAFWATHPDHLGMFGRLFGLACASPDACTVLEIGCAVGGNLLPMAASAPGSRFFGVDLSEVQIDKARQSAAAAGIANVTLMHGDFREVPAALGPFDYIICHGVFAWVDAATQDAILAFIGRHLAPHGVAFVSYNAYPGQHMVEMVRRLLQFHTAALPDIEAKREEGLAMLRLLHRISTRPGDDWRGGFLAPEIRSMQRDDLSALAHDYLSPEYRPSYFVDFVARAAHADLAYLADSSPWTMYPDNHGAEIVDALGPIGDLVAQGQYLDFFFNTRYRETLLCRAGAPLSRAIEQEVLQSFHFGHALSRAPSLDGLTAAEPVDVLVVRRPPMKVQSPLLRLALSILYAHGRVMLTFDELTTLVADALRTHGLPLPPRPELEERLCAQLLRAFFACAVRLSLRPPPLARQLPERPRTGSYQRLMARQRRPGITSLTHEVFEASPMMYDLLPHLDGTRDHAALQALHPAQPIGEALAELARKGFIAAT